MIFVFQIQYLYFFLQSLASQAVRGNARGCVIPAPTFQNPERLTKWNLRGFQLTESEKYSFPLDPTAISWAIEHLCHWQHRIRRKNSTGSNKYWGGCSSIDQSLPFFKTCLIFVWIADFKIWMKSKDFYIICCQYTRLAAWSCDIMQVWGLHSYKGGCS